MDGVSRPVTFASASRVLAGDEDRLINTIDYALSGLLLVTGQLGLFDPKNDLIGLLKDLRSTPPPGNGCTPAWPGSPGGSNGSRPSARPARPGTRWPAGTPPISTRR
jgi:hypothetical protein